MPKTKEQKSDEEIRDGKTAKEGFDYFNELRKPEIFGVNLR